MVIALAGAAAATFGAADFLGGSAARRVPSAMVAVLAEAAGLVMLLALVLFVLPATPVPAALAWGALAGVAAGFGVLMLYRALAAGPMNVVAPLAALTSAVVPVLAGVMLGERPSGLVWMGIALALVAGTVVGAEPTGTDTEGDQTSHRTARGAVLGLISGACFGGFFTLVAQAEPVAGLWPVTMAKVTGALVAAVVLVATRPTRRAGFGAGAWINAAGCRLAVSCGVLDALADGLYLLAVQQGQLTVVGVVVALYPVSTVLLARLLRGERVGPMRGVGLAFAVAALILVGAGGAG